VLQEAPSEDEPLTDRLVRKPLQPSKPRIKKPTHTPSRSILVQKGKNGHNARPEKLRRVRSELSADSKSAARLAEPRFGRESVLVWLSTAVAIVLVVLAYWLSGQVNPTAQLVIDVEPKSAELVVNTKKMGAIAGHGSFDVAPGDVLVEVRASGYCPWYRNLTLTAKETFSTRVVLQAKPEAGCPQ